MRHHHHRGHHIRRDLGDRLQLSVHYASTPTLSTSNSVEENSVNSDDCDISSSSGSSNYRVSVGTASSSKSPNSSTLLPGTTIRIDYQPSSSQSTTSYGTSSNSNSIGTPSPISAPSLPRNRLGRNKRLASVSTSRLSAVITPSVQQHLTSQLEPRRSSTPPPLTTDPSSEKLLVTEDDIRAIETCYRGHKTRVFVCSSLANLYLSPRTRTDAADPTGWRLTYTGIPVLLLDSGATKSRTRRQIQLLLVEKGTCFTLWRDVIDNLSKYTREDEMFHVLHLSTDHSCRIGLSFDSSKSAQDFYSCVQMLTSDPANISLSGPMGRKASKSNVVNEEDRKKKYKKPSKAEISRPCGFQHVVSVGQADTAKYYSLQAYVERWRKEQLQQEQRNVGEMTRAMSRQSLSEAKPRLAVFNSCNELNC